MAEVCLFDSAENVELIVDASDADIVKVEVKRVAKGYGLYELRNELVNMPRFRILSTL